jgi:hypothetical protein
MIKTGKLGGADELALQRSVGADPAIRFIKAA